MRDVIVIGAGPAGISASLYAKRANLDTLVFDAGKSQVADAHKIDNYYGFPNGISGGDLYSNGIEQAKNLGVEILNSEVTGVKVLENGYAIVAGEKDYETHAIIIATGKKQLRPAIAGLQDFEGKGVSYCAVCDGFFYRKKKVVVIGAGNYAFSEANELSHIAQSVQILTNGEPTELTSTEKISLDERKIKKICGSAKVESVEFEDGTKIETNGVFVALGSAGGADFAKKLGIALDGDSILTDKDMATNISGVFSCGNATGGLLQICKAVYEGAVAGISATNFVRKQKKREI